MHFLVFRITGENIDLNHLTNTFQIQPDTAYKKGDTNIVRGKTVTYIEDCWLSKVIIPNNESIDAVFSAFIKPLLPHKGTIQKLREQCEVVLWLTLYPDTYQAFFLFSKDTLSLLDNLGIDFHVTIMSLQEIYDGTYIDKKR